MGFSKRINICDKWFILKFIYYTFRIIIYLKTLDFKMDDSLLNFKLLS
jgi:hypothetical protein